MRSRLLRESQEGEIPKAKSAKSAKSAKRKRPAGASMPAGAVAARKGNAGEVILDASLAAQFVATCTHANYFLDDLMAVANAQLPVQPVPQNILTPTPVPQNVLSHYDPSVPLNVTSPFAPASAPASQIPLAPTTTMTITGEDIRELSQSLDQMEQLSEGMQAALGQVDQLSEGIKTALGQVQSVTAVLRKILRR